MQLATDNVVHLCVQEVLRLLSAYGSLAVGQELAPEDHHSAK